MDNSVSAVGLPFSKVSGVVTDSTVNLTVSSQHLVVTPHEKNSKAWADQEDDLEDFNDEIEEVENVAETEFPSQLI